MKNKWILSGVLLEALLLSSVSVYAMPTEEFDYGMNKGIEYYNQGLYYEAKDEFQWFCDYNWGRMNEGQQKYALDYLGGAKQQIQRWENRNTNTYSTLSYDQRRKLNTFMSNFSEAFVDDYDKYNFDGFDAVNFAFIHNLINNSSNILWSGSQMGISFSAVNSTLGKYMGTSVDRNDYSKYEYGYNYVWHYSDGMFWTGAASGESYDYYTIVNGMFDNGDGTYKITFNVYYAGYDELTAEYYSYTDSEARNSSVYQYSGWAIIKPKLYNGSDTWELIKLVRN